MDLKQLSLFLILYDPSDKLSLLFAWTSVIPIFIVVRYALDTANNIPYVMHSQVGHAAILLFRRELFSAYFFGSYLVGEILNSFLKSLIKQARPEASYKPGYGMPSDHAQFMACTFILVLLLLYVRVTLKHNWWKHLVSFGALAIAVLVSVGRYWRLTAKL